MLLSVYDNVSVRKFAKIERNDAKRVRITIDFTFGLNNEGFNIKQKEFALLRIKSYLFIFRIEKESQLCL